MQKNWGLEIKGKQTQARNEAPEERIRFNVSIKICPPLTLWNGVLFCWYSLKSIETGFILIQLKSVDHWHRDLSQFNYNEVFNEFGVKWYKFAYKPS